MLLFHANVFRTIACGEHSNFLKVNGSSTNSTRLNAPLLPDRYAKVTALGARKICGPANLSRSPTTSFLTATTLIYAIGVVVD